MKINILEERFIDVVDILAVKSYLKRIDDYVVENEELKLCLKIDLTYLDQNMTENFKTLQQPCEVILKNNMHISNVTLVDLELWAVENKGVNIKYNIDIDYELGTNDDIINDSKDDVLEDNPIVEIENSVEEAYLDNVELDESQIIQNEYQEMLGKVIEKREDNKEIIEVIENDENSFINLFNQFKESYIKITKIAVTDKNEIIDKYSLTEEEFDNNYDRTTNVLTIRSYD